MGQREFAPTSGAAKGYGKVFPPEAEGDFPVVPAHEIAEWRKKLSARFGIGAGRMKTIEEPRKPERE